MKTYRHGSEGRHRVIGYHTNDSDLYIAFVSGSRITGETTHIHTDSDELYITVRGKGTIWVNGKIYRLQHGVIKRVGKGEPHRVLSVYEAPLVYYTIKINTLDDKVDIVTPPELLELMKRQGLI